jgi:hypothetical protein
MFECLDSRTFVETESVFGRSEIDRDKMFHLGKEVRVGDLKEVFSEMGAQMMNAEHPLQCASARADAKEFRVIAQMLLCPS